MKRYKREKANIEVDFVAGNVAECENQDIIAEMRRKAASKVRNKRT